MRVPQTRLPSISSVSPVPSGTIAEQGLIGSVAGRGLGEAVDLPVVVVVGGGGVVRADGGCERGDPAVLVVADRLVVAGAGDSGLAGEPA